MFEKDVSTIRSFVVVRGNVSLSDQRLLDAGTVFSSKKRILAERAKAAWTFIVRMLRYLIFLKD